MATVQETRVEAKQTHEEIAVELPAPKGWKKMFTPPKKGGTPKKNSVFFISPDGNEIKSKKQLEQYLRTHSGNPPLAEFDWGTGDTPRRSSRLSEKSKATETPESEPPKKREKKSSSKKGAKENKEDTLTESNEDTVTEGEAPKEEDAMAMDAEATKLTVDAEMKDAEGKDNRAEEVAAGEVLAGDAEEAVAGEVLAGDADGKDKDAEEVAAKGVLAGDTKVPDAEDAKADVDAEGEGKDNKTEEVATGEVLAVETKEQDSEGKTEKIVEENAENTSEANNKSESDTKERQLENNSTATVEEAKETEVPAEKEKVVEAAAEGSKDGPEEVKEGESLPNENSQNSLKDEVKVDGSMPENSSHRDNEAKHQPQSLPVDC